MSEKKKICSFCFDLILPYDKYERIKLEDGTEITVHVQCMEDIIKTDELV